MSVAHWPNPIHDERPNQQLWSRANMAEAIPGVATTLTWTFWEHGFTAANRDLWSALGVLTDDEARRPQGYQPEHDFVSIFYGRPVVNVDRVRDLFGRVPGGDPDRFERQMLGSVREGVHRQRSWHRWPAIVRKAPTHLRGLDERAAAMSRRMTGWWRHATSSPLVDAPSARVAFREAVRAFDEVQLVHGLSLMVGQLAYGRVEAICRWLGHEDLTLVIASSGSGAHETAMLDALWEAAHGDRALEAFLGEHGYHGPDEGALHRASWREDPSPLLALMERYRQVATRPDDVTSTKRSEAIEHVVAAAPRGSRALVRKLLRSAGRSVVRREVTKAAFLQCIDAARHAARSLGKQLAATGVLDEPDDVFHLTLDEVTDDHAVIDRAMVAFRKERWHEYHGVDIPTSFVGQPVAVPVHASSVSHCSSLRGIGASDGTAVGRVRIVHDPSDGAAIEPGEVLVCHQTDPAWTPMLLVASAAVVEIGGPLSHAAIVARELGVPCVVAVDGACRQLSEGALVRVDGTRGTVEVVS
jgi:pyruvate,water dikinase